MACDRYAFIKALALASCIVCIVYKRVSDDEGQRLFIRLGKINYEWPLLRYVTWEQNGSSYADITYGSYVLITTALLIGYVVGEVAGRVTEGILLGLGALLFITVGSLELAALDSVPEDLVDNAAVLGVLSLLTGFLFLLDILLGGKKRKMHKMALKLGQNKITQTDKGQTGYNAVDLLSHKTNGHIANGVSKSPGQNNKHDKVVGQLKSSLKGRKTDGEPMRVTFPSDILNPPQDLAITDQDNTPTKRDHMTPDDPGKRATIRQSYEEKEQTDPKPNKHITGEKLERRHEHPGPYSNQGTDESDLDDLTTVPNVAFLLTERGQLDDQQDSRGRSVTSRTNMLPMIPVAARSTVEQPNMQKTRSLDQPIAVSNLEKRTRFQMEESEPDFPQEVVIMSPSEREEYMAYVQTMKNLNNRSKIIPMSPSERDRYLSSIQMEKMKDVSIPEEISEEISHMSPSERERFLFGIHKHDERDGKKQQQKGSTSYKSKHLHTQNINLRDSRDFAEDIGHMSPREREQYLFGGSPKHKESVSVSPAHDVEGGKKSPESKFPFVPPEDDGHWRFDSRDANLIRSTPKSPRHARDSPSSPMDPGYVLHTAHNWPDNSPKTPSQSPTEVTSGESDNNTPPYRRDDSPIIRDPSPPYAQASRSVKVPPPPKETHLEDEARGHKFSGTGRRSQTPDEENEDVPSGGSLTTQLLQKWLKQRHTKVSKMRSNP